jgi:hypothetical protein
MQPPFSRFSLTFTDVSRTLCPVDDPSLTPTMFYIDVFTSSPDPLNYSVRIDPVDNFTLRYVLVASFCSLTGSPSHFFAHEKSA